MVVVAALAAAVSVAAVVVVAVLAVVVSYLPGWFPAHSSISAENEKAWPTDGRMDGQTLL